MTIYCTPVGGVPEFIAVRQGYFVVLAGISF